MPPLAERSLAPKRIGANRSPHLSPVGSLTNLLTDLSSTGFRKTTKKQLIPKKLSKEQYATINSITVPLTDGHQGLHMFSPKVQNSINYYFSVKEKNDIDKRMIQHMMQQEQ